MPYAACVLAGIFVGLTMTEMIARRWKAMYEEMEEMFHDSLRVIDRQGQMLDDLLNEDEEEERPSHRWN